MSVAIRTEGLSKLYRVGAKPRYGRFSEVLSDAVARRVRRREHRNDRNGWLWALKDVSLEVPTGEVLGIIGRNGAGKTTLLKILSRITWPTRGEAEVRGRVGSLLEVGTGFHPELTGRENIYLNGAILGMSKADIDRKMDEIVEFAEVSRFLDLPVKRYSTGMHVRLAFAVAAHLDSEVLFVDEVLAVGDYRFQRKCLETMRRVGETGHTVILVSHNFAAIRAFCTSGVWIDDGQIRESGDVESCISRYLEAYSGSSPELTVDVSAKERPRGYGTAFRYLRLGVRPDAAGRIVHGGPLRVDMEFEVTRIIREVALGFSVHTIDGAWIFQVLNTHAGSVYAAILPGRYVVEVEIPHNALVEGRYFLTAGARCGTEGLDWVREPLEFDVFEADRPSWWLDPGQAGVVRPISRFSDPRPVDGQSVIPSTHGSLNRG